MHLEQNKTEVLDACIKCSACTALCPVARVNPSFPGPKHLGPDAERFRLEGIEIGTQFLNFCSKCRTCEVTCPSGVNITEMISRAQEAAKLRGGKTNTKAFQHYVRDWLLGRAEYLGEFATIFPPLTNWFLGKRVARRVMELTLGISSQATLPSYQPKFIREIQKPTNKKQVLYFPGCFVTYNDAATGHAIVKVLEYNGYEVIVPPFHCCGTPLEGNGFIKEANDIAIRNLELVRPYLQADVPVITGCTSCSLALKEYPVLEVTKSTKYRAQTYDLFEFLWELHTHKELREDFKELKLSLGYHAPCHLKAQGIGTPSIRLLRLIPGIQVIDLDQGCCGLSGSYGYKKEKYTASQEIGKPLFERIFQGTNVGEFKTIITECGGCQVQISHGSGIRTHHPVWILLQAYGLE